MSLPKMKAEKKSPISGFERIGSDDEQGLEKLPPKSKAFPMKSEIQQKNLKNRPVTAAKSSIPRYQKPIEVSNLLKIKPRQLNVDKEKLYEENLELKQKNNTLNDENLKLKTKLLMVEKELNKKDENFEEKPHFKGSSHLVSTLKQMVKDLKAEVGEKNLEVEALKKNAKTCRVIELETEMKVYIDECTRLKHHLEEVLIQKNQNFEVVPALNEKNSQFSESWQKKELQEMKQLHDAVVEENKTLKGRVEELERMKKRLKKRADKAASNEIEKIKSQHEKIYKDLAEKENRTQADMVSIKATNSELLLEIKDLKSQKIVLEGTVENLNMEVSLLKKELLQASKRKVKKKLLISNKSNNAPKLLRIIHSIIRAKNMFVGVLLSLIDKNNIGMLEVDEFLRRLSVYHKGLRHKDIEAVMDKISVKSNFINFSKLESYYEEFNYENTDLTSSSEEIDDNLLNPQKTSEKSQHSADNLEEVSTKIEIPSEQNEDSSSPPPIPEIENHHHVEEAFSQPMIPLDYELKIEEFEDYERFLRAGGGYNGFNRPTDLETITEKNESCASLLFENSGDFQSKNPEKSLSQSELGDSSANVALMAEKWRAFIQHIFYRLQLNRIPRASLFPVLFRTLSPLQVVPTSLLASILKNPPLNFVDLVEVRQYLGFFQPNCTASEVYEMINGSLENWENLTEAKEQALDSQIEEIISSKHAEILESCAELDLRGQGYLSTQDFFLALKEKQVQVSPECESYMKLLFYSFDLQLDSVPYKQFIESYMKYQQSPNEISNEERTSIVRHYLDIIAQILIKNNITADAVFQSDADCLISPHEFMIGLNRLGLDKMPELHVRIMIEALQYEGSAELCISLQEISEIFSHYGVGLNEANFSKSDKEDEYEEEYEEDSDLDANKKSMLESLYSENYEEEASEDEN